MRTHSSHCACAPESCVYFPPPLHMQALFCASVLRATSWGSLQASCLRSQRLSANSAPLRATQVHAAVSSDDSGSERHMLTCPGISGRPQKALKKKKSYRKNSSAKFPYREDAFLCLCVCVSFFLLFFSHQFEVWSWFKFEDSNYPAYVCACACVFFLGNICSSLALFSPPLRGPPLSWVLDSLEKRGGQRWRKRNTPAAISVEWILSHRGEISISRFFRKLQLSVSHFPYPLFTLCFPSLLSSFPLSGSPVRGHARSLHPPPSRQQMLGLDPDVVCLSLSNHIFFSYSKHLQRRLLSSAAIPLRNRQEKKSEVEKRYMLVQCHLHIHMFVAETDSRSCSPPSVRRAQGTLTHMKIDSGMHALHSFCTGLSPTSSPLTVLT